MSVITLNKWGNMVGVSIPEQAMRAAKAYIGEQFELSVNSKGGFTLVPIQEHQKGWLEAFNAIADKGEDKVLMDNMENVFDKDEWQW